MLRIRVVLALALLAGIPFVPFALQGGNWPACQEGARYFVLFDYFRETIAHGVLYPRWLPDLHGGLGYPTFVFYQPGYFYWQLPFSALTDNPFWIAVTSLYGLVLAGTAGVWLIGRNLTNELGGYVSAGLFVFTPYAFVNLYWRCDLSELAALLIAPWPFALTLELRKRFAKEGQRELPICIGLVAALTALIYSHPVGLVFVFPVYCAFLTWILVGRNDAGTTRLMRSSAAAIAIALALTAPYWMTILQLSQHVNLHAAFRGHYTPERHIVDFIDFVWPRLSPTKFDFAQLGAPHLLAAILGVVALRHNRVVLFGAVATVLLLVAMTELALPLWSIPAVRQMQFPWRLMCVVATLQVICASGLVRMLPARAAYRWLVLGVGFICVAAWYQFQFQYSPAKHPISREMVAARRVQDAGMFRVYALVDEFRPRWAPSRHPVRKPADPMIAVPKGVGLAALPSSTSWRPRYRVTASEPVSIKIRQFYFPGWRVEIDGKPVADEVLRRDLDPSDGTMRLAVPAGSHRIEAWYDGPPGWQRRNIMILIITLVGIAFLSYLERRAVGHRDRPNAPRPAEQLQGQA